MITRLTVIKKKFTLQKVFLCPSVIVIKTDVSNPNFYTVDKKLVHNETNETFWVNLPPNFAKKFIFQNEMRTSPFSNHLSGF